KSGISATWQLAASREGVYAIGPPSVSYNGQRIGANPLRVTVHPAGSGSGRRRPSRGPSPFDPFGMFPRMPGGLFQPQDLTPPEEQTDPSLQVDAAPDARVFLRSVVDQKTAVVGEQVTLTIFLYTRVPIEQTELHEPSVADFFRRDFLGPNTQERAQNVSINGVLWRAQVVYKSALFPLRSGELEIGPMQESFVGGGAIGTMVRQSQPIRLHVSEPPASGRPVGYQVGDVGNYALSAVVEPRTSEVGGAIAVTITLGGVGNVPTQVRVPANSSMEWLEPQVRETIDIENGKVRGSRTFSYVVRPKTAGSLELGAVTLPYWDPDRKLYDIARVGLGKITVTAADKPIAGKEPSAPHDPWSALAAPREQLGAFQRPREPLTDRPFYWFGLFGAPLAVVAGSLGARGARGANRYLKKRRSSKERGIDEALSQARAALGKRDAGEVASQLERALYLALERATDLKARGVLRVELAPELERRGVPADLAAESAALLSALETSRFAPEGAAEHRELVERVASAVKRLHRIVPPTAKVEQE
ncbi:MAG TPA: BatD family protein, partial [Polyangiaceae bacterium]